MKTIRQQVEERRQSKLNHIQRQIKAGKLVVRQMTVEERAGDRVFPRKLEAPESAGSR
jgi:hypothetical protein